MSQVYILMEDGQHATHEESEVEDLLAQRLLSPETYFWKEGMTDWRPLAELTAKKTAPVDKSASFVPPRRTTDPIVSPETPIRTFQTAQPYPDKKAAATPIRASGLGEELVLRRKSTRNSLRCNLVPLTVSMLILFVGLIPVTACLVYQCLDKINGWSSASTPDPMAVLSGSADLSGGNNVNVSSAELHSLFYFAGTLMVVHVVAEVLFLFWIYYANKNCRGMASNMIYTPNGAVACFFIPIVNLFRPYQVVQELWKVSKNPKGWIGRRDSIFVAFWFVTQMGYLFLVKVVVDLFSSTFDDPHTRGGIILTYMAIFESAIILMELTTLILVSFITWWQIRWARAAAALS